MRRAQTWRTNRARSLRANDTSAEAKLWAEFSNRQLGGLKFVRQAPIGPHFADFICRGRMVVVEVDGGTHSANPEIAADGARSADITRRGFRIFRVTNADIYDRLDDVLDALLAFTNSED